MKRVFQVEFMERDLRAEDYTVLATDVPSAIDAALALLTRDHEQDPKRYSDPMKVWVSNVTLEQEIDE